VKFKKNTAVTILLAKSMTTVQRWTNDRSPLDTSISIGELLHERDEGTYWARGHDEETAKALLVARALR
jgi:hypothetical protein